MARRFFNPISITDASDASIQTAGGASTSADRFKVSSTTGSFQSQSSNDPGKYVSITTNDGTDHFTIGTGTGQHFALTGVSTIDLLSNRLTNVGNASFAGDAVSKSVMESIRNVRHPTLADNSIVFPSLATSIQTGQFVLTNGSVDVSNGNLSTGTYAFNATSLYFTIATGTNDVLLTLSINVPETTAISYKINDDAGATLVTSPTYQGQNHYFAKSRFTSVAANGRGFIIAFTGTTGATGTVNIYSAPTLPSITYDNTYKLNFSTPMSVRNIPPNRALITDSTGLFSNSAVTSTELGYLSGVTSALQDQINGKLASTGGTITGNLSLSSSTLNSKLPYLNIGNTAGGAGNTCGITMSPFSGRTGGVSTIIAGLDDGAGSAHLTFSTAAAGSSNSAAERMRITNGGFVGIGTTTVNSRLSITPGTQEYKISLFDGTNKSGFGYNASGIYYTLDSATIWHTFYVNGTTNRALQIGGAADPYINLSPTTTVYEARLNIQERAGLIMTYYTSNTRLGGLYSITGNHLTYNSLNDTVFSTGFNAAVERMRVVGSTGFVGIGTASPSSLLTMSGATASYLTVQNTTGGSNCGIYLNTLSTRTGGAPTSISALDDGGSSAHLRFSTAFATGALTERMRITSSGQIVMGVIAPTTLLTLTSTTKTYMTIQNTTAASDCGIYLNTLSSNSVPTAAVSAVGDSLTFSVATQDVPSVLTERLRITSEGKIGINTTTTPSSRLSISPTVSENKITLYDGTANIAGFGYNTTAGIQYMTDNATIPHVFYSAGTANRIMSVGGDVDGLVVIGPATTSFDARLNVQDRTGSFISYWQNNTKRGGVSLSGDMIQYNSVTDTAFSTAGTERMRISANGNVGIGAIAPATLLHLHDAAANSPFLSLSNSNNNTVGIQLTPSSGRTGGYPVMLRALSDGNSAAHFTISTAATGTGTASTERIRVQANGWVGIGTTTAVSQLTVASNNGANLNEPYITLNGGGGASSTSGIAMATTGVNARSGGYPVVIRCSDDGNSAAHLKFLTAPSGPTPTAVDRMIITAQGTVGINTVSPNAQLHVATSGTTQALCAGPTASWTGDDAISRFSGVYNTNAVASFYHSGNAAGQTYLRFMCGNTPIGSVTSTTAGQIQYNTTSDGRLKENIVEFTSEEAACIDDVDVHVFNFKSDENKTPVVGFIAQEIMEVIPQCVTAPSDPETGVYMMNESRLIPYLVKAVQDLRKDNRDLRTRLTELELSQSYIEHPNTSL